MLQNGIIATSKTLYYYKNNPGVYFKHKVIEALTGEPQVSIKTVRVAIHTDYRKLTHDSPPFSEASKIIQLPEIHK
jgi:hypothetical protein